MIKKYFKKLTALFLALCMMSVSITLVAYADENENEQLNENEVSVSANYTETDDNTYRIDFSTLTDMPEIYNISFSVSALDGANFSQGVFDSSLMSDYSSVTRKGTSLIEFESGAYENPVSGKVKLCTVEFLSEDIPSEDNLNFFDFVAFDENDQEIEFSVTLTVDEGPVIPELSEDEQKAYDLIVLLPSPETLSFYDSDGEIIELEDLSSLVSSAVEAYNELGSLGQANVEAVLEYNGKSIKPLTLLPSIVLGMTETIDIVYFYNTITNLDDSELIDYRFMTNVYADIIPSISSDGLPSGSLLLSQYNTAKSSMASKKTLIDSKYKNADYDRKIESITNQLEIIQSKAKDTYYDEYIDDLLEQANILYSDIDDNYKGSYKEYILKDLAAQIEKIELIKKGVTDLPTYDISEVHTGLNYLITFVRASAIEMPATVKVKVYNVDKPNVVIDEFTAKFPEGNTKYELRHTAIKGKYPTKGEVIFEIYYTISDAEIFLGTSVKKCTEIPRPDAGGTGGGFPSDRKQDYDDDSDDSGTVYPTSKDDDDDRKPTQPVEEELFNDLENYGWAKEAIEGLYYAGIVNGMGDGSYNPAGDVTREQFCKMIVQLFGVLQYENTETTFKDVDKNAWYAPYISSAVNAGYVQGQSDEFFGIGQKIMRQDMATMLYRALGGDNSNMATLSFTDNADIASYALDPVAKLVGMGAINGYEDGSFKPRGTATRAEAAKVIWEIYKQL